MNSDPRGYDLALNLGRNPTVEERTERWRRQLQGQASSVTGQRLTNDEYARRQQKSMTHENDSSGNKGLRSAADMAREPIPENLSSAERLQLVEALFSAPRNGSLSSRSMCAIAHDLSQGKGVSRGEALEFMLAFSHPRPRWIKCSERMPENHERVMIWWGNEAHGAILYGDRWETDEGNFPDSGSITHWMPLPGKPDDA